MDQSALHRRRVTRSRFGDNTRINLGDIHNHLPHRPVRFAVRHIPYPRNEDLVYRPDLIDRLDKLLPQTSGSSSAALWGLGGSGKTQIALDYAYRRYDADDKCCVFWVHADNEATFTSDYKTIGKKLGVDEQLDGSDLLDTVRNEIEARSKWVMVLDNADDLSLFGVGRRAKGDGTNENQNLRRYVPCTSQGMVLWTSRDAHIAGTLVGPRRGIEVRSMAMDEAITLLARARDDPSTSGKTGAVALLEELQCLPLAISQAGAYMRRMSVSAEQYLDLLRQGKTRWEVLKMSDADRHRRPEVPNSVLETWRISTERIRVESEMSYRILHVVAYVDSQDIPHELIMAAASRYHVDDKNSTRQVTELKVTEAVTRLKEFSFLSLRQREDGGWSYEMHKLVQEAVRYGLGVRGLMETTVGTAPRAESESGKLENSEVYYSGMALQIVDGLFPPSEPASWARCEQYTMHAIRVGEWAEVNGTETETSTLLKKVSRFLHDRGRWREKESVDNRAWNLQRGVLGEKHPDTIWSMASLAATYDRQGRYNEAERLKDEALDLRREVLGEKHPDTIWSMASLAATYHAQGRYHEAEGIYQEVLELRRAVLGEKHPDTIRSMASLTATYHAQGRYHEAEGIYQEVLELRRAVLGEKHPDTISSMASLAATYHAQGRYHEAEGIYQEVLELQREVLGEKHPDTINSMADLVTTYHTQGQYNKTENIYQEVLELRREVLGEKHPHTISSMASLATTYHTQGRYDEAEKLKDKALDLRREVLGEEHPNTISSMASLAATYHAQGRYHEAEGIYQEVLELRRAVLGEKHPDTIRSMASLTATYHAQGRYHEAEGIYQEVLELRRAVLGEKHPDTINSMASLAATYHAQGRYHEAEGIYQEVLELQREVLGEKHPDTISSMASLAATYHAQGRYHEAEGIYQEVLELRRAVLGEKHPDTIRSMASLAATYHAQGRYNEAERLHRTALDLRRHVLGESHPDTIQSVEYLVSTQEALQQLPPLTESVQSLTITKVEETEEKSKTGRRSLWKDLRRTADKLCKSRYSRKQGGIG
ncbi:hypothetical protein FOMA001_g19859 [Fusarium oxysporum f. sp. matthiolae]|nr:hypothetical protein FOMA001_g19859 [Fusarium oxysporum f. sp. matthiolae]